MIISVVGNGLDLKHDFKTSFKDFLEYFPTKYSASNLLYLFFYYMKNTNGWLDFEMQLQEFLVCFSDFVTLSSYRLRERYYIDIQEFNRSHSRYIFTDILPIRIGAFMRSADQRALTSDTSEWRKLLENEVKENINEVTAALREYLTSIQETHFENFQISKSPEMLALSKSNVIYTFNYTNFLEKLPNKDITYVHGKLDGEIILGVPYTRKITHHSLSSYFKTSQAIFNKYLKPISIPSDRSHIVFIGFSFGKSDHYFFEGIKPRFYGTTIDDYKLVLHCYYYDAESQYQLINNLRDFFGETDFIALYNMNQIKFYDYTQEIVFD